MWNILKALRYGSEVADVEAWKKGQIRASLVVSFLASVLALLQSSGYDLNLNGVQITDAGNAIHALVTIAIAAFGNACATAASSKRAGLIPKGKEDGN